MTQRPLLIAVEGCDGTGKTTLVAALVAAFQSLSIPAASIKRPAKDALAAFYAQGQAVSDSQVLAMMNADCLLSLAAARTMQSNGTPIVILDRHYLSAAIYQGGDDWAGEFERQRERWGEPDVWVFCDAPIATVDERIGQRAADHHANEARQARETRLSRYREAMEHVKAPVIEYWSIGLSAQHTAILARYSWEPEDHFEGDDYDDFAEWIVRKIKRMPNALHP